MDSYLVSIHSRSFSSSADAAQVIAAAFLNGAAYKQVRERVNKRG